LCLTGWNNPQHWSYAAQVRQNEIKFMQGNFSWLLAVASSYHVSALALKALMSRAKQAKSHARASCMNQRQNNGLLIKHQQNMCFRTQVGHIAFV
jgi:hypothetical protein